MPTNQRATSETPIRVIIGLLYYDDVGYFTGIVRIGQFDGRIDAIMSQTRNFTARIELAK